MHKLKNRKLLSIFMAGMISYACISIDNIYANENSDIVEIDSSVEDTNDTMDEENNNIEVEVSNTNTDVDNSENEDNSEVEVKDILINDINNSENIGLNIKTQGNITKIQDNKIYIKDESGEGIVYLENISVNNLNIGDSISIIGNINQIENENSSINAVIVNDVNNIELIITEETPNEDKDTNVEVDEGLDKEENNKPSNQNNPSGPTGSQSSQNPSFNTNSSKPSGSSIPSTQTIIEEVVVNTIKGKTIVTIKNDLTSAQWEKVNEQLEEKNIKVKDLKNNKIRITQVNDESGDNIWIVNDPRMLDSEEEEVNTIGKDITDTLLYSEYDVSESKWNTIVEDVESGSAKIKYDSDKNIKVIYQKNSGKDSIITLNRIETE